MRFPRPVLLPLPCCRCHTDIIRLMQHRTDLVCATDVYLPSPTSLRTLYYDIWVGRHVSGDMVQKELDVDFPSGLPTPMYCCWNGVVVLRFEPFKAGVRFRTHLPGECRASECTLLCDDMHRLGYSSVVMDPGVQVAYFLHDVKLLYAPGLAVFNGAGENASSADVMPVKASGLKGWPIWDEATKAAARSAATLRRNNSNITCCDLLPGNHHVDFNTCHRVDVMKLNFTHIDFKCRSPGYTHRRYCPSVVFNSSRPAPTLGLVDQGFAERRRRRKKHPLGSFVIKNLN